MNSLFRACALALMGVFLLSAFPPGHRGALPLTFAWRGAAADRQMPIAHVSGRWVAFDRSGAVLENGRPLLRFVGARPSVRPQPEGPPSGTASYFLGSNPEQWRTDVPMFNAIRYKELYPGVDLIYYGSQNHLEYDLVIAPGAAWRSIRLRFGAAGIKHGRPMIYQETTRGRRRIPGRYARYSGNQVGFTIGPYDPALPLIIDPALIFASYFGGSGDDYGHAIAVDATGCAYLAGETGSVNLPTQHAEQALMAGASDVFIAKWNAAGTGLVYATYIGGSGRDAAFGVAVDPAGNAYVTGFTYSANFPVTSGVLRTTFSGGAKAFVLKLNASGDTLVYSTFLGGNGEDYGTAIALDSSGDAQIAGYTASVDFPTTSGAFQQYYGGGSYDGFVAKLNASGAALLFATYLGGIANDTAAGIAVDATGNIYVTGQTQSSNFPTLNPLQPTNDESDAFVVKMNATGQVIYSTFLGGTGLNSGTAIAADASGKAYVTGFTDAPDFPVSVNAYQPSNTGFYDSFVAILNSYGSAVLNATYLGGSGSDASYAIGLDGSGNVFIAGATSSIDFPTANALQPAYGGGGDVFVAGLNNQLSAMLYATYFGGTGYDAAAGIAVDSSGNEYVTGSTSSGASSTGLPVTPGVLEATGQGGVDSFLAKISPALPPQCPAVSTGSASTVTSSTASVNGSVNPNGSATQVTFAYSTNSSMAGGTSTVPQQIGSGTNTVPVSANLTGLAANTTYYFETVASNSAGTVQGNIGSFTTPAATVAVSVTASPSGASVTIMGTGCAPGTYTLPASLSWTAGVTCSINFRDPAGNVFQSSTINGSGSSSSNPRTVNAAAAPLSINAIFTTTTPATATHLSISAPLTATTSQAIQFTVTALDSNNQKVAAYTDPVHFTSTDPAARLPQDSSLANGTGNFTATLATAGQVSVSAVDLYSSSIKGTSGNITVLPQTAGFRFVSMQPCRVVDTRDGTRLSGFGTPSIGAGATRSFSIPNGPCIGIPANVQAYALNVTVIPHGGLGFLTLWPTGQNQPGVSTLNSYDGEVKANAAIVAAGTGGAISVFATDATDLVLDVNGYFVPGTSANALAFYPLPPCRLVDTRPGAPSTVVQGTLSAGSATIIPILSSSCQVPPSAAAYSLNFTLAPPAKPVGFMTVWPTGQPQPLVSTLNDPTGTVEANAAIAPAGIGGSINVFVTDATDLLVDINGYFAPPASGALSLYTLPPCRVLDTRSPAGALPFVGAIDVNVTASGCGAVTAAQAYVFNATVVPPAALGFLTLWPEGSAQPVVSTLNAYNSEITNNMAIVPSSNGQISAFAIDSTWLILDLFAYFAP